MAESVLDLADGIAVVTCVRIPPERSGGGGDDERRPLDHRTGRTGAADAGQLLAASLAFSMFWRSSPIDWSFWP